MPKKDKYTLGEKLGRATLDLTELLIMASYADKEGKNIFLDKANAKLELLKILVRLSEEVKAINTKKYLLLEEKLQEMGKMLGGWMRSLR
ncbi:four helix bundle protein [Patescibacteria group bacterium]|nr:four helix bundle protein [Patescibacteria group bacterium]